MQVVRASEVLCPFACGSGFVCGIRLTILWGAANDSSFIEIVAAHARFTVLVGACDYEKARLPPAAVRRFSMKLNGIELSERRVTVLNIVKVRAARACRVKNELPIKRSRAR